MLKIRISFTIKLAGQNIPVSHCYQFNNKIYFKDAIKEIENKKVLILYTDKKDKLRTYSHKMKVALKKAFYYKEEVWRLNEK